jgi:hypothetical protein
MPYKYAWFLSGEGANQVGFKKPQKKVKKFLTTLPKTI